MARFSDVFLEKKKKGYKIHTSKYLREGKHPIVDQGKNKIAGYTNLEEGLFTNVPAIIFGDHTRIVKYIDVPFFLGADGVKILKSKLSYTDYKYLFYCLANAKIPNTGYNRHFKWLKAVEIPLPPMEEQKKIAAVLDKVSDLIAKRRRQLDKLDLLVKARFVEMFGDPITNNNRLPMISLDKLGAWNSGGTPSRANPKYFSGEIDWYSAGELNSLYLTDSIEKITQEAINNSSAKLFREGSMLVGMYDTAAFKMGILQKASASNQACACIEPNDRVNIVWLYHVLQQMKDYFLQQRRGVRQKNLNLGIIKSFEIPFADKALQNQFADFVEQTEKTKASISHSLETLEMLKKSLMQEYFG